MARRGPDSRARLGFRERPFRLHRFDVAFSAAAGFVYDTGIGTIPRPDEESARFLEGGYEYRRYFARAIGIRSLHAGVGVRGGGERRTFERHRGGNELTDTTTAGLIAGVAALRFRPAGRVSADVDGETPPCSRGGRQHLVAGTESEKASWGGGWFTDLDRARQCPRRRADVAGRPGPAAAAKDGCSTGAPTPTSAAGLSRE